MNKYTYITYLLDLELILNNNQINDILKDDNENYFLGSYYDIILIEFIDEHNTKYNLKPYGSTIKMDNSQDQYLIEKKYISSYDKNKFLLIKFEDKTYGYIETDKNIPIKFESQELIQKKLLEFFLNCCSC